MDKLTPFARILIGLLAAAVIGLGVYYLYPGDGDSEQTTTNATSSSSSGDQSPTAEQSPSSAASASRAFDYEPPKPVNGVLKGVVEVGASGFNSFIIKVDKEKRWELVKADFGKSLVYEKMTTPVEIKEGLKKYIGDMSDFGVLPHNIHFVISSGAQQVDMTQKMITYIKERGFVVNAVTAEQEGRLALKCAMPPMYKGSSFMADIGSGNTKISWFNGESISAVETHGAKYFQKGTPATQVFTEVKAKATQVPSSLRSTCFVLGGVPFELAKQIRNGKERYTILNMPGDYKAEGEKQAAGLNIYKALQESTGCKNFVFDWDSNFTIGFLLSL